MQITHCSDRDFDFSCSNSNSDSYFEFHYFVSSFAWAQVAGWDANNTLLI